MVSGDNASYTARLVLRTGALTAAIVAVTILASLSMIFSEAERVNEISHQREKLRFGMAIQDELALARAQLAMVASGRSDRSFNASKTDHAHIRESFTTQLWPYFGFGSAYVVNSQDKVVFGQEQGEPAGQVGFEALRPALERLIADVRANEEANVSKDVPETLSPGHELRLGVSRLMHDGTRVMLAVAVPLRRSTPMMVAPDRLPLIAVGVRELGQTELDAMAAGQGLAGFRLLNRDGASGNFGAIALPDGKGEIRAWLDWIPYRPGDALFSRATMVFLSAMLFIAAVFIWVIANLRHVAVEMARREEVIGRIAAYDELSGLHNRRSFDTHLGDQLSRIRQGEGLIAVILLDLDRFKPVNDLHGHKVGDELIRCVARRLRGLVRGGDCVARLGGDEFAIIQSDIAQPRDAALLGQRILEALREPFVLGDVEVGIGVSMGIALSPVDATDQESLVRMADTALYQAKSEGRNRFCFFERNMDRSMQMSRIVAEDLRSAIENDELVLHYQPQMSADGQRVLGAEALVRWHHPVHGMIPPNDFIPIAEQRGLIVPLSQWVLRRACLDAREWDGLRVAVNISPIDFRNSEFVENVSHILGETGFDPSRLELELTEGVVVEDADAAEQAMIELHSRGISLALDDFGTGYSSLIYLRRFAFDKIKIDRSFLEYMETTGESAILVHSVVHLGRALGLRVCAEGVETAEQHRFLQAVGCHELQGYFFSRPLPAAAFGALVETMHGGKSTAAA
jgi:diguanylate cyclase (GGDEF)-like protein